MTISSKFEKRIGKIATDRRGFKAFSSFRKAVAAACGAAITIHEICPQSYDSSLWLVFSDDSRLRIDCPMQSAFGGSVTDCSDSWIEIESSWIRVK